MPWTNRQLWLYHATTEWSAASIMLDGVSPTPRRPGLDFGPGFYTTSNWSQACEWANKVASRRLDGAAIVRFECDYTAIAHLPAVQFASSGPEADDYWDFVRSMKSGDYDEHVGGSGLFTLSVGGLAVFPGTRVRHPDTDQYSFHGDSGLAFVNGLKKSLELPFDGAGVFR